MSGRVITCTAAMLLTGFLTLAIAQAAGHRRAPAHRNSAERHTADGCCIQLANRADCEIFICIRLANGIIDCTHIPASYVGQRTIPCDGGTPQIFIRTACGDVPLGVDECKVMHFESGCCDEVCLRSIDGCLSLVAVPAPGPCNCP